MYLPTTWVGYSPKYHAGMMSFDLSYKDAQNKDNWRLKIKGTTR